MGVSIKSNKLYVYCNKIEMSMHRPLLNRLDFITKEFYVYFYEIYINLHAYALSSDESSVGQSLNSMDRFIYYWFIILVFNICLFIDQIFLVDFELQTLGYILGL